MRFATEATYDDHCFDFYDAVGDDIGSGYVCVDFRSTNVAQLSRSMSSMDFVRSYFGTSTDLDKKCSTGQCRGSFVLK